MIYDEIEEYIAEYPIYQYAFIDSKKIEFSDRVRTICKKECEYDSLWTKQNKTFEVNKKWNAIETTTEDLKKNTVTETKRKLVF